MNDDDFGYVSLRGNASGLEVAISSSAQRTSERACLVRCCLSVSLLQPAEHSITTRFSTPVQLDPGRSLVRVSQGLIGGR